LSYNLVDVAGIEPALPALRWYSTPWDSLVVYCSPASGQTISRPLFSN